MKVLVNLILLATVVVLGYTLAKQKFFPCIDPLTYEIGNVDPEFGVSEERLARIVGEAEALWEEASGEDLFTYTEDSGEVEVSLVFDERQQETIEARVLEETLDEQSGQIEQATGRYQTLVREYEAAEADFNERVDEYNKKRASFEDRIRAWNQSDRTDQEEFEALEREGNEVDALYAELEQEETELAELYLNLEQIRDQRNSIATEYNVAVETYNTRFGGESTFDQGEYDGRDTSITVYQFEDETDLTLVLAHELGHALGIDHVEDPTAIMHYLMREQSVDPIELAYADILGLEYACRL